MTLDDPFNSPMEKQAAALAGEPPEIMHLRELAKKADADMRAAHKRLAALLFAIRQYEIYSMAEDLNS